jgi:hypothetical protein
MKFTDEFSGKMHQGKLLSAAELFMDGFFDNLKGYGKDLWNKGK